MADLDDFFAKRDKKKPKGKKFESTDDVAKILETKAKERKKQETIKSTYTAPLTEDGLPAQPTNEYRAQGDEDDEWKEVVEEKPDYTGLKIGELVLNDDDSDVDPNEQDGREGNDGSANDGPWSKNKALRNKKEESSTPAPETAVVVVADTESAIVNEDAGNEEAVSAANPEDSDNVATPVSTKYVPPNRKKGPEAEGTVTPKPTPSTEVSAPKSLAGGVGGAYVPPSRRAGATGPSSSSKPKKSSAAPDIDDQKFFPSLGS